MYSTCIQRRFCAKARKIVNVLLPVILYMQCHCELTLHICVFHYRKKDRTGNVVCKDRQKNISNHLLRHALTCILGRKVATGYYRNAYGQNFWFSQFTRTWYQARSYCRRLWGGRGRLASINNNAVNNWLYHNGNRAAHMWHGANDLSREGHWKWDDNCPMTFKRWNHREPNNYHNEDCGHFVGNAGGKWNDINCNNRFRFVCKKVRPNYLCDGK